MFSFVGAYRDNNGHLKVLDCIRQAEEFVYKTNAGHEYLNQG
jgi:aspartate/tyrosine/aromatic aminotransferase